MLIVDHHISAFSFSLLVRSRKSPARRRIDPAATRVSDFGLRISRRQAGRSAFHSTLSHQLSTTVASARGLPDREDDHERRPNRFLYRMVPAPLHRCCVCRVQFLVSVPSPFTARLCRGAGTSGSS